MGKLAFIQVPKAHVAWMCALPTWLTWLPKAFAHCLQDTVLRGRYLAGLRAASELGGAEVSTLDSFTPLRTKTR